MKALYKDGLHSFGLVDRPKPVPKRDEILLKVDSVAICHTDVLIRNGAAPHGVDTFIPGHEFSGIIEACGESVDYLSIGDRGVVQQIIGCNHCRACRMGKVNQCENFDELGVKSDGGFAEYCVVPSRNFHRLPEDISLEDAALTEPLANAVSAVYRTNIAPLDTVVVIGPGAIGLLGMQVANLFRPSRMIMVGTRDERLAIAKRFCDRVTCINVNNPGAVDTLKDGILEGKGADVIIECSGTISGVQLALDLMARGGRISFEGSVDNKETVPFSPSIINTNGTLFGVSGWEPRDFQRAFDLIASKTIDVNPLVTHRFPLVEWEMAFEMATTRKSESIRVLLKP